MKLIVKSTLAALLLLLALPADSQQVDEKIRVQRF